MRIGITGPHGSGKTTLLDALRKQPEFANLEFMTEVTRHIQEKGFPINEGGALNTQILIMAQHIQNVLLKDDYVVDRAMTDGVVYTAYLHDEEKSVPSWFMDYCEEVITQYIDHYDYLIYVPAEFEIEDDGCRSVKEKFHKYICDAFESLFEDLESRKILKHCSVIKVTGSVEDRVNQILDGIKKKGAA